MTYPHASPAGWRARRHWERSAETVRMERLLCDLDETRPAVRFHEKSCLALKSSSCLFSWWHHMGQMAWTTLSRRTARGPCLHWNLRHLLVWMTSSTPLGQPGATERKGSVIWRIIRGNVEALAPQPILSRIVKYSYSYEREAWNSPTCQPEGTYLLWPPKC